MIAGVTSNGKPYISDFHTDCDRKLTLDANKTGICLESKKMQKKHFFKSQDPSIPVMPMIIPHYLASIIWAYGETDQLEYTMTTEADFVFTYWTLYFIQHQLQNHCQDGKFQREQRFHPKKLLIGVPYIKYPQESIGSTILSRLGFGILENEVAVGHVHHYILWRCQAPNDADPRLIFEHLVSYPGEECYFNDKHQIPINLCRIMQYVFAVGGKGLIVPGDTGFPFGEFPYYMLETHYNNPEKINGLQFEAGVELVYTSKLRPIDAGTFAIGYDLFGLFMVPPASPNFDIPSHCDNRCTSEMFPSSGVDVFAVQGHTHGSGRKLKVRHFRGNKELPWIYKDENYDWTLQITRPLQTDRKILPGDHLTLTCSYDNTWTNTTTPSGFASRDEMCLTVIYHKTPIPYSGCSSQIPQKVLLGLVGVQNVTWDQLTQKRIVTSPPALSGQTLADITDRKVFWSKQLRATIATKTTASPQIIACPITTPPEDEPVEKVAILARGYGDQTLMGPTPVPVRTPGPHSVSGLPYLIQLYVRVRNCPAI
ncbi:DBH-like monooxygenase protein 1 [Orchesella cincta]|uniref:DBH-like monooxygenase protein 1 n=1 Tax=Orchesella cincta TaxID=48709 RepID=A0A1D2NI79_ORCCI|nr:DBH-like monooxygenase protein 1 [Orchesella cincta]